MFASQTLMHTYLDTCKILSRVNCRLQAEYTQNSKQYHSPQRLLFLRYIQLFLGTLEVEPKKEKTSAACNAEEIIQTECRAEFIIYSVKLKVVKNEIYTAI